ncbi:MAG: antibiotic biosynthesis monooxygenase [Longimicrobiales bacterium]
MVITVLKAEVREDRVADLEQAYRDASADIPTGIVETFLARDAREATSWHIITVWSSRVALEAMRASGATPKGVQIFRAAGAEPDLSVLEVVQQGR